MKKPRKATKTLKKSKTVKDIESAFCALTGISRKEARDLFSEDFYKKTKKRSKKSKKSSTHGKSDFA
jgi:hypothetical protein